VAVQGLIASLVVSFEEARVDESTGSEEFTRLLHEAALACHESLLQRGEEDGQGRQFATTLTFFLGFWPHAYLLQVGDSRCYLFQDGKLTQISRDQTLAQELIDSGVLTREHAERTRWANVLSSAIGGVQAAPVVSRVVRTWGSVVLLCSDGLTKHVSEAEIEARIAGMTSAREVGEDLLQLALERGGTDNITIVIGRTRPAKDQP
jgi:protein phosphatase